MKKAIYNKSNIMKRAWELYRTTTDIFADCLKRAWEEAKASHIKFENNMEFSVTNIDGRIYTRTLTRWTKGNHDRIYINGGSRRGDGWVDIKTGFINVCDTYYACKMAKLILCMQF